MTDSEILLFRRLATDGQFKAWLDSEAAENLKVLANAEGTILYRAQGKAKFIEDMKKYLQAGGKNA